MRLPLAWLRTYVDLPDDVDAIAEKLSMLGFPVESIERKPTITGVVVGRIAALEKHPNADRLQVCTIEIGAEKALTIATAATNVAVGQWIPVAQIGAILPHITIAPRKMRGIDSEGMLCSAEELALPAEWFEDGIMQLDETLPLGTDVVAAFGLCEPILEVEITSNRADAMSVLGIARELAAAYGSTLRSPSFENPGTDPTPTDRAPKIDLRSSDCTRFVAQRIEGVRVAPAPSAIRIRLAQAGQRPIDALVDISNYVMLEIGEPLHFYDADAVPHAHLIVRDAAPGERLTTIDERELALDERALVIADENGIQGLAGIKGGNVGEVRASTTALIVEGATFVGARIRRTSARFALRTEASARHERTLPPALADAGVARAASLLASLGAKTFAPVIVGDALPKPAPIALHASEVRRLLGIDASPDSIAFHLRALGCEVTIAEDRLAVRPPWWRRDLSQSVDLIEEYARLEGYERIPEALPCVPATEISSARYRRERDAAHLLEALGYREVLTYSLIGESLLATLAKGGLDERSRSVEVANPLSEEQRYLRASLEAGLLAYLARRDERAAIFEIGHAFSRGENTVLETPTIALALAADASEGPDWQDRGFMQLKSDALALLARLTGRSISVASGTHRFLHPGICAELAIEGRPVGVVGRVHPYLAQSFALARPVYLAAFTLDALAEFRAPIYTPPSKFPATYRDLALVLSPEVEAAAVERIAREAVGADCVGVRVFDEYRGAQVGSDKKSLAVRITLQSPNETLTDAVVDERIGAAIARLHDELGATVRR
ncbi:MAG: phenylalanine--tRNA ligase subunit beta [Candidatus Baltobacteraceae bacterium]